MYYRCGGGSLTPVYSRQKVTSQKSVSRTIVRSDVVSVNVSQASPPMVPPLPIWYRPLEGRGPLLQKSSCQSSKCSLVRARFAPRDILVPDVVSKLCSGDCAECQ